MKHDEMRKQRTAVAVPLTAVGTEAGGAPRREGAAEGHAVLLSLVKIGLHA